MGGLNCVEFNKRLFKRGAAILEGPGCDMARPHAKDPDYVSPYLRMFRFSFGPLLPETFDEDIKIMSEVLEQYKKDVAEGKCEEPSQVKKNLRRGIIVCPSCLPMTFALVPLNQHSAREFIISMSFLYILLNILALAHASFVAAPSLWWS